MDELIDKRKMGCFNWHDRIAEAITEDLGLNAEAIHDAVSLKVLLLQSVINLNEYVNDFLLLFLPEV